MKIRRIEPSDAEKLRAYYRKNSDHFRPWEPRRENEYYSKPFWGQRVSEMVSQQKKGEAVYFLLEDSKTNEIIAHCTLSQIFHGVFKACYMGYAISESHQSKGLMERLCRYTIEYAFDELDLHRIMANYMPYNNRSARLLSKLGFCREGYAKNYLKINGRWEDHVMTSLVRCP